MDARVFAIVLASLVNKPGGGWVESVVTRATQRLDFGRGILTALLRCAAVWKSLAVLFSRGGVGQTVRFGIEFAPDV